MLMFVYLKFEVLLKMVEKWLVILNGDEGKRGG